MPEPITDPTPVAPVVDPKPQEPASAVPEPKADPAPTKTANPWEDPAAAKAEIERLRRENGSDRTNAKKTAADEARNELAQTIGKALGLVKDEPVDPAELTKQLTATQAQAQQAALELAIFRSAPDAAVANALLDSRSFLAKIADLDPTDGAAITAAVTEAVESIPALGKRAPAPNPAQGSGASGPSSAAQLTEADVKRLNKEGKYDEIVQAQKDGRLNTLLGVDRKS
jgi:hypothetical protein